MITFKNFTTIHLQLNQTIVLEVAILLMTYLIEYKFQIKLKIEKDVFNMITGKINKKF